MTRILIADDHECVRRGLKEIVSERPDLVVAGEAAGGAEALARAGSTSRSVDIAMPGRSGLDILKELRAARPALKIIVLSTYPERSSTRCEACATVRWPTSKGRTQRKIFCTRCIEKNGSRLPYVRFSDREVQALGMLQADPPPVGSCISFHGPRWLLKKMGMETHAQLIRYAVEHRLELRRSRYLAAVQRLLRRTFTDTPLQRDPTR